MSAATGSDVPFIRTVFHPTDFSEASEEAFAHALTDAILGAAGLLEGKRATTHWSTLELLPLFGAIPDEGRVVRDGNVIMGGGVTAGIDFALAIVAEIFGRGVAESIELRMEYAPAPPFGVGHPHIAPAELVSQARANLKPIVEANRAAIGEAAQRAR